ncbi:MAG: PAS domain-containing protein, partial [Janthinobacterium sp.]
MFLLLVAQSYTRERDHVVSETAQAARAVAAAVERDLSGAQMAARVLAASPALQGDDLNALRAVAASLLQPGLAVNAFIVSDAKGRQLVNTALPASQAPPPLPQKWAASMERTRDYGKPRLTSLAKAPDGAPQLALNLPLPRDQGPAYVLTALYSPDYLPLLLRELHLPAYLGAAIINGDGINVARTLAPQRYVGQRSVAPLLEQIRQAREGVLRHATLEGLDVYTGFRRGPGDAWTVAVTMRTSTVAEALLRSVVTGSIILALLLAAGFALAWRVGGRLASTLQELTLQIHALAQGKPLLSNKHTDRESADMAGALGALERDLRRHRTQLESLVAERTLALEKSTRLLETVYATAPIGMLFVGLDLRIVMINQYLAAINGASVAQHLGRPVGAMLFDDAVRADVERCVRQVLETGLPIVDIELKGHSGQQRDQLSHWIVSYHPIFGPEQQLLGVSGLWLDVSERKRSEAEFRRSKHLFGTIIENIPAMVFVKRADKLSFEMVNRHAELTLGRSREQLLGKTDHDFFPPQQAAAFVSADRKLLATGQMVEIEQEAINTADGTTRHFTTRKVVLRDDAGRASHVLGVSIDITDRKRATEVLHATTWRLEQNERFIRTVTDNLPGMVSYWGADLRCRFANNFYNEWFGRSSAELAGIHMSELLGQELFDVYAPHVEGVLAGRPQSFERDLLDPAGQVCHTWTNYSPDFDDGGSVRGFFVLASDVSELKRTELRLHELNEQMVRARDKAEAASIAKSEFVANMSHEIRTPMNAIIGLARLLEESPLERRERSYVGKIQMATQSLLNIVNDVLDFSKIEAGQMVLEQRRFQLERMLDTDRRRPARGTDPDQPGGQRRQIHLAWRSGAGHRQGGRGCGQRDAGVFRARHGHRHRRSRAGTHLRRVFPGRQRHQPQIRRHGSGAGHLPAHGGINGWQAQREKRAGRRLRLPLPLPLRQGGAAARTVRQGGCPGPVAADHRRQRQRARHAGRLVRGAGLAQPQRRWRRGRPGTAAQGLAGPHLRAERRYPDPGRGDLHLGEWASRTGDSGHLRAGDGRHAAGAGARAAWRERRAAGRRK